MDLTYTVQQMQYNPVGDSVDVGLVQGPITEPIGIMTINVTKAQAAKLRIGMAVTVKVGLAA